MIVPISANLAFPLVPYSSILYASNFKIPIRARAVCCLRKNELVNGLMKQPIQMELEDNDHADFSQTSASETELKKSEIWKLFREAQQNILYLNKQRLMAEEELNKANKEKQALLDRIEELEAHQQSHTGQDKLLAQWGVLLRIDSMVLTGMIGTKEASDLRRLIMDSKVGILDALPPLMMQTRDSELLLELRTLSEESKRYGFHVIHICTEMEPVVTVGSLASYVTGLSRALQRRGNSVEVILPKYKNLDLSEVQELREIQAECHSYFNGQLHGNRMWTGVVHGIGVTLIEPVHFSTFFNRDRVYGYSDDFERFMYFSRASLDYIVKSGKHPDVLHIHNWETSIIGPLFWDIFVNQGLGATRILLTCQDFSSQCVEQPDKLGLCGLDPLKLHRRDRLQDNAKPNLINILKGGVVYSNKVIIMSSIHSKGLIIQSRSHGLESTLTTHKDKLIISPSGFNYSSWDPSKDKFLPENYTASNLKGKAVCKAALQQEMGLSENPSAVVIGCIFPETSDVDLENLMDVLRVTSMTGVQVVNFCTSSHKQVRLVGPPTYTKTLIQNSKHGMRKGEKARDTKFTYFNRSPTQQFHYIR